MKKFSIIRRVKSSVCWLLIFSTFSGCAVPIKQNYELSDGSSSRKPNTGTLLVSLSSGMADTSVLIDGRLMVDKRNTSRIEIANVPVGKHSVQVVGADNSKDGGINHKEDITIKDGETNTIVFATPSTSTGYWLLAIVVGVAAFFIANAATRSR